MPDYLSPGPVTGRGQAPSLRFQFLGEGDKDGRRAYVLAFGKGDEVASGLTEFAAKHGLRAARFTAIGAFESAELAWFDRQRKEYRLIPVPEATEVVSLIGNVGTEKGEPIVHAHCSLGREDGTLVGGHLLKGRVYPTLELYLIEEPAVVEKAHDPETGLELMDL